MRLYLATVACALGASPCLGALAMTKTVPGAFIDISGFGTFVDLAGDEEFAITTTIGNAVFPAGTVIIANNGGLGFAPPDTNLGPVPMPLPSFAAFGAGQSLLPYWADIGNHVGAIYWAEVSGKLIVQWQGKHFEGADLKPTVTFQAQINGGVPRPGFLDTEPCVYAQIVYQNITTDPAFGGQNATIGYQDGTGGSYNDVQWSHHTAGAVLNGDVLSLVCPAPGTLAPLAGVLALGATRRRRSATWP